MIYVFFRITAFFLATSVIFPNGTPKLFKICFSLLLSAMIAINLEVNVAVQNFFELIRIISIMIFGLSTLLKIIFLESSFINVQT